MICFERGKSPKEAMEIGAIARPLVIEEVIYATKTRNVGGDSLTVSWSFDFETERSPSHCMRILQGIGLGELNPEEYAVSYCEAGTAHIKTTMISDLLGTYVSYRGERYKIPTMAEITEMRKRKMGIYMKDMGVKLKPEDVRGIIPPNLGCCS